MRLALLAAVVIVGLPITVAAEGMSGPVTLGQMTLGYTYFNKPRADLTAHDADVKECAADAARALAVDDQLSNSHPAGLALAVVASIYHRGAAGSALENCMVVRGWRVVKIPDEEGQAL